MRLLLLGVGKPRDRLLAELLERYLERLRRHVAVETAFVAEVTGRGRSADEVRRLEAERLREALARRRGAGARRLVALDERGRQPSTAELARQLGRDAEQGVQLSTFVIGGPDGLDPELVGAADRTLALSRMTFTHELALVLLAEQLYRSHAILAGHPYHRS